MFVLGLCGSLKAGFAQLCKNSSGVYHPEPRASLGLDRLGYDAWFI